MVVINARAAQNTMILIPGTDTEKSQQKKQQKKHSNGKIVIS